MAGDAPSPPRRRWRRRLLVGLVIALGLGLVLVAAAPTIVSLGPGQSLIRSSLEKRISGSVSLGRLELGWLGAQSVRGLTLTGEGNASSAVLDARIDAGLLALLTGRAAPLGVSLSGRMAGELRADGSTSFEDLLRRDDRAAAAPPRAGGGPALAGFPAATVEVEGLTVRLREPGGGELGVEELKGTITYRPGLAIDAELTGSAVGGSRPGSVTVTASTTGLVDAGGALRLAGASGNIRLELRDSPVPLADRPTELSRAVLAAETGDLARRLDVAFEAEAEIDGEPAGTLRGALVFDRPVTADGRLDLGLRRLRGEVTGRSVPAGLIQPALRGTPLIAARDVGPALDVDARFSAGSPREVAVSAAGAHARLEAEGTVDAQRTLRVERAVLEAEVSPGLAAAVAGVALDARTAATLRLDALSWGGTADLREAAGRGELRVEGPARLRLGADRPPVALAGVTAGFETAGLGGGLRVQAAAEVDGAELSAELTFAEVLDESGRFAPRRLNPAGELRLTGLAAPALAAWVGEPAAIDAALGGPLELTASFAPPAAELAARSPRLELTATLERPAPGRLRVARGEASLEATPQLVAALRAGGAGGPALTGPARVTARVEPFDLPLDEPAAWLRDAPLRAAVAADDVSVTGLPGLVEAVAAQGSADVALRGGEAFSVNVDGRAALRRAAGDEPLGEARCTLAAQRREGRFAPGELRVELAEAPVAAWARVLGESPRLSRLLGEQGAVAATARPEAGGWTADVDAAFPRLEGAFAARTAGDAVEVTAQQARLVLSRAVIEQRLGAGAGGTEAPPVSVESDLPLEITGSIRLPRAGGDGAGLELTTVSLDADITGGPLVLVDRDGGRTALSDLALSLRSSGLAQGVRGTLRGRAERGEGAEAGRLEAEGTVTGLVRDGALQPARAVLQASAVARGLPTAAVDALCEFRGLLVAAVGPRLDADVTADALSGAGGTLAFRLESGQGWLEGRAAGGDDALRIAETPVRMELALTPPLRRRVLSRIHPLFADVRQTEQPLRGELRDAVLPLDADMRRLRGDLDVTVGPVEFESGSLMLALLEIAERSARETIPGSIEPVRARIRDGIVTYERFAVRIDKYTLVYSGTVDLVRRRVDLRTEVPLEGLAGTFRELEGYAESVTVPLITRGPFGELETEVDPKFLADAGLNIGIDKGLKEVEKETGVPVGDILEGLFGGRKKKEQKQEDPKDDDGG